MSGSISAFKGKPDEWKSHIYNFEMGKNKIGEIFGGSLIVCLLLAILERCNKQPVKDCNNSFLKIQQGMNLWKYFIQLTGLKVLFSMENYSRLKKGKAGAAHRMYS